MRPFRDVSMVFGRAPPGRGAPVNVPARRQADRLHVSKVIHGILQGILTPGRLGAFPALQAMEALLYAARSRTLFASFLGSSAVEHSTVNRMVAGSNPARGANWLFFPVAAVQHTATTHCKSITLRLRPRRHGSAPFAHIGHFFGVSDGVSTPGVADMFF
jgi:hypothetical protein